MKDLEAQKNELKRAKNFWKSYIQSIEQDVKVIDQALEELEIGRDVVNGKGEFPKKVKEVMKNYLARMRSGD